MGERLNPLRFRVDELPRIRRRREQPPTLNRRLPTMARGGHSAFYVAAELETTAGRFALWRCAACFELVPGWLLTEGRYDRCAAPRRALPPASHHRDPRRSST
jgi:hypothetical protein